MLNFRALSWCFAGAVLIAAGCAGSGVVTAHGSGSTGTTGSTGSVGESITKLSPGIYPFAINTSGAALGNNGGLKYLGGTGVYFSPNGTTTNLVGVFGTSTNAHANAMNNAGVIVGNCANNSHNTATVWTNLKASALLAPSGPFTDTLAYGINDSGQIVGQGTQNNPGVREVQTLSESGSPTGGTFTLSVTSGSQTAMTNPIPYNATATQVGGQLDGLATVPQGSIIVAGGPLPTKPLTITFTSAGPQNLIQAASSLSGGTSPKAAVVRTTAGQSSAYVVVGLYWPSPTSAPKTLAPAGFVPVAIGGNGEAVGYTMNSSGFVDSYWKLNVNSSTTATLISNKATGYIVTNGNIIADDGGATIYTMNIIDATGHSMVVNSDAQPGAINKSGDVVGTLFSSTGVRTAFIYTQAHGLMDLNKVLPANSGWVLNGAYGISDNGKVVGDGTYKGQVATPYILQLPTGSF